MFFGPIEKQEGRSASYWLRHFRLLLWNHWTEFDETLREARIQRPLPSLCFWADQKTKMGAWPLIGWDIFDFSSETTERNLTKLYRKQELNVLYQVFVFGPIGKPKWPPRPLICWYMFYFCSETAERNLTKLDRKQELNVLGQVCGFWPIGKPRWPPGLWLTETFSTFSLKLLNGIWFKKKSKNTTSSTRFAFFGWLVGCIEDLRRFSGISAISRFGSSR